MNSFVNFIFESGISLGLFTVLYLIFLQKETFFKANRFFLLFALVFSSVLPLLHFGAMYTFQAFGTDLTGQQYSILLETVSIYGNSVSQSFIDSVTASSLVITIYLFGVLFFSFRLLVRLSQISLIIRRNKVVYENDMKLVVLEKDTSPFSFLSYVFTGANIKQQSGWEKMLIHEYEHVRQRHTIDVLFLEIISVLHWFNPFFWLLKRMLRENHEYLADRAVLIRDNNSIAYRQVLLSQLIGRHLNMANNFNYSIKKRIKMMTQIKSSKLANMKVLVGMLLAIALVFVFACDNKDIVESGDEISELKSTETTSTLMDDALIIVDGEVFEREVFNQIAPDAIESINVLKENLDEYVDKYGDIARNGVILITLKEGATLSYNTDTQIKKAISTPKIDISSKSEEYEDVFVTVEEMPQFPGGEEELRQYLKMNVKYPIVAQNAGIQGKVYVSFIVEKDGSVGRAKIVRGVDESLDNEALRVVSAMPKWEPGKQDGQTVAVQYTVPISFELQ